MALKLGLADSTWLPSFCAAAMVLLSFVSFSVPIWFQVSFLNVGPKGQLRYGIFGYTQNQTKHVSVGYDFILINKNARGLTQGLILHPIAAVVSALAAIIALMSPDRFRSKNGRVHAVSFCTSLALVLTTTVFIFDAYLFITARKKYRDANITAEFGIAFWFALGATAFLFIASLMTYFHSCVKKDET